MLFVRSRSQLAILAVVVVALGVILVSTSWNRPSQSRESDSSAPASVRTDKDQGIEVDLARRDSSDPLAIGDEDAPVVLIEYADFRCPFCGVFARETKPELMKYVEDGTLRMEYRDLPIFGEQSTRAAMAGRAAGAQGRFWEFYDAVFADAPPRGHASLTDATLTKYAKESGVPDLNQFKKDMNSQKYADDVQADADEASDLGASSTPLFLVGDEPILGAQPASVFIEKIYRLAKAK